MENDYLTDILETYKRQRPYNLRTDTDLYIPNYRLMLTRNSFFPSTIISWNKLDKEIRDNPSYNEFKSYLKSQRNSIYLPDYLLCGDRKLNIIHTRLRSFSSNLHSDLHRVNLISSSSCQCGHSNENAFHFFFECALFDEQRNRLVQKLLYFTPLTLDKLLFGDLSLSDHENYNIMDAVYCYIKETKRFT